MKYFEWCIKTLALILAAIVWTLVGLFFWVPLLFSSIALFSATVAASVWNSTLNILPAQNRLQYAISFYSLGFNLIHNAYKQMREDQPTIPISEDNPVVIYDIFWILFKQAALSVVIWCILILLLDFIAWLVSGHALISGPIFSSSLATK